jgi:hypothetical protein
MIEIKIGILLDACGIRYTKKQLSKLEELVNNFIEKHVNRNLKQLALGSTEHELIEHYEHNQQEDYFYEQMRQVKTEIKTEEESFLDDKGEHDKTENTLDQGNLLRGIVNFSGAARNVLQGPKQAI